MNMSPNLFNCFIYAFFSQSRVTYHSLMMFSIDHKMLNIRKELQNLHSSYNLHKIDILIYLNYDMDTSFVTGEASKVCNLMKIEIHLFLKMSSYEL